MGRIVVLDQGYCTGCGGCVELCPEVFAMDELTEKAGVILSEGGDKKCIEEAMAMCPGDCIFWENGG